MARNRRPLVDRILLGLSLLLWLVVAAGYWLRPDPLAALTAWPMWSWVMPGVVLLLPCFRRRRSAGVAVALVWVVWVIAAAEEPRSLGRAHSPGPAGLRVRVVSLNCSGGSLDAAEEVIRYSPDVVLLQETPGKRQVEALARRLYGSGSHSVWGIDASVLSRWEVTGLRVGRDVSPFLTGAHVRAIGGKEFSVFSVRLAPPVFRVDLWAPRCWRAYARDRHARLKQAAEAAAQVRRLSHRQPVVLGGDMNVPAGDGSLEPLRENLRDCFIDRGRGWGNTVLNEYPVLRFDQVWASRGFAVTSVTAHRTTHSDHRMVVCDLVLVGK